MEYELCSCVVEAKELCDDLPATILQYFEAKFAIQIQIFIV